jgi:hypothetical protein
MVLRAHAAFLAMVCASACSVFVSLDDLRGTGSADAGPDSGDAPSDVPSDAASDSPSHEITFVQEKDGYYDAAGLTFSLAVADGHTVIVAVVNSKPGAVTVTDDGANSYMSIIGPYAAADGGTLSLFVSIGVKGGYKTVHVSPPDGGTGYSYYAAEYAGITKLDGTGTGSTQSTGTDALVTNSVQTNGDPELLFAFAEALGTVNVGTGFTERSLFDGNAMEDRIVNAPNAYQATATLVSGPGDILLACFH